MELTTRKKQILKVVTERYIDSAECLPVILLGGTQSYKAFGQNLRFRCGEEITAEIRMGDHSVLNVETALHAAAPFDPSFADQIAGRGTAPVPLPCIVPGAAQGFDLGHVVHGEGVVAHGLVGKQLLQEESLEFLQCDSPGQLFAQRGHAAADGFDALGDDLLYDRHSSMRIT